jgi:hypothetical protein
MLAIALHLKVLEATFYSSSVGVSPPSKSTIDPYLFFVAQRRS